ncbi:zinc ribbon domain-containing protein [Paenibacillus sp. SI8]|uniref:zinc ribbon domain-containing protein n=1 Tax=unclassified Paenibacillus TaxID=185978 RepID=UPI0034650E5E
MAEEELQTCVRCGFVADKEEKYCIKCGAPLKNRCTKKKTPLHGGCGKINKRDAKYCSDCGTETLFSDMGLL